MSITISSLHLFILHTLSFDPPLRLGAFARDFIAYANAPCKNHRLSVNWRKIHR
jgi:hypothetical protein